MDDCVLLPRRKKLLESRRVLFNFVDFLAEYPAVFAFEGVMQTPFACTRHKRLKRREGLSSRPNRMTPLRDWDDAPLPARRGPSGAVLHLANKLMRDYGYERDAALAQAATMVA